MNEQQAGERESFSALLQRLHAERYTGAVTLHFGQGIAHAADLQSQATRITLTKGKRKPQD